MEHTKTMHVLVVEDEPDVRRFFTRALLGIGPQIQVVEAADGCEALARLRGAAFDLVLSDQRMPNMTGLELLIALRTWSDTPFLLISANRSVESEAYAAGANEFLSKPISLDGLRAVVSRYLPT